MPPNQPHNYESMKINISTVVSALAIFGMLAIGWYANATDDKIEEVKELAVQTAKATAENTSNIKVLITTINQNQEIAKEAAADARSNRETLIRIEAKLPERE